MIATMTATLDSNIFVYAADNRDGRKQVSASNLMRGLRDYGGPVGLQVIGEFQSAMSRKLKFPNSFALNAARNILVNYRTFAYAEADVSRAITEAATGRFSYWDALLLSAAERNGVRFLISEDMADGMRLGQIEVVSALAGRQVAPRAADVLGMK
jgi:predicted nucleic acid-binding protein